MGCRDQLKRVILISFLLGCCLFTSCMKKQDVLFIQTEEWIRTEFGSKAVIQSISPIPVSASKRQYWRISVINENGTRWEGLVQYSLSDGSFKKYEIPLSEQEVK